VRAFLKVGLEGTNAVVETSQLQQGTAKIELCIWALRTHLDQSLKVTHCFLHLSLLSQGYGQVLPILGLLRPKLHASSEEIDGVFAFRHVFLHA
jgi:hypothetical protein